MSIKPPKVRFVNQNDTVIEDYYDKVGYSPQEFAFLSPVTIEAWSSEIISWVTVGDRIGEVGPGQGCLTMRVIHAILKPTYYLVVDISNVLLDALKSKVAVNNNHYVTTDLRKTNIAQPLPNTLNNTELDRLLVINVLQDVEALPTLQNLRRLLRKDGLLRITFLAKEAEDQFSKNDPHYDAENGYWYSLSPFHEQKKALPLGYIEINGSEHPFFRVQRFYTQSNIAKLLQKTGFRIKKISPIVFPTEHVLRRWTSATHHTKLTEAQWGLLEKWGGYFDEWDVEAVAQ